MPRNAYKGQWHALRLSALERDGYRCRWCGGLATEADHVRSLAIGGTNDLENLVAACRTCNARRGAVLAQRLRRARRRNLSTAARRALGLT